MIIQREPRIELRIAHGPELAWAKEMVAEHHYLRSAPDVRSKPLAYLLLHGTDRVGCLWFGRPESTCCYQGELTYGGREAVAQGRAKYDRWEVLNLSRVWLSPRVQEGGRLCQPGLIPGYLDPARKWRPALGSAAIRAALGAVGLDYLLRYPPCFLDEPYAIRVVLSYCDRRKHHGTLYRASGFRLARCNAVGIETYYTTAVGRLKVWGPKVIARASAACPRAAKIRARRALEHAPRLFASPESQERSSHEG